MNWLRPPRPNAVVFLIASLMAPAMLCSCPGGKPQSSPKSPPPEKRAQLQQQMKTMVEKGKAGGAPMTPGGGPKAGAPR